MPFTRETPRIEVRQEKEMTKLWEANLKDICVF